MSVYIPMVLDDKDGRGCDLFSRLLRDRIILLTGPINDDTAALVAGQLLYLESQDPEKEIFLYLNSPGGSVTAGLAILDTMRCLKCPVSTICMGQAASMAAILLAAGTRGKRLMLPNSEAMIHQPVSGMQGQVTDLTIHAQHVQQVKDRLTALLAGLCGQEPERVARDLERDHFLTAREAVDYGLADQVLEER